LEENRAEGEETRTGRKAAAGEGSEMLPARPLTLETYHRFFLDPWNTRITVDQLNQVLYDCIYLLLVE
jgi:hypothetical protein